MRILVTRPEPDATTQAKLLRARGYDPIVSPLLDVTLLPVLELEEPHCYGAIVVTSRNALRAIEKSGHLAEYATRPAFCVGRRTAEMASAIGFTDVRHGASDAYGLLNLLQDTVAPGNGKVLRLVGDIPSSAPGEFSAALRQAGYVVADVVCYRITPRPEFSPQALAAFRSGEIGLVILMSPLTARTFLQACTLSGLTLQSEKPRYVCISKNVADELFGIPQACKLIADKPNQNALLCVIDHAVAKLP